MKTILVPIDFSESSIKALDMAFKIALANDSNIYLLNVCETPAPQSIPETHKSDNDVDILKQEHEKELKNFMNQYESIRDLSLYRHLSVSYDIVAGNTIREIIHFAEEIETHAIVMGTHGQQKSFDKELGSVAQSLIGQTKIPVLAIPYDVNIRELVINNIAYAIDYHSEDYDQLFFMLGLCEVFNSELHVLHVSKNELALAEGCQEYFKKTQSKLIEYERLTFELLSNKEDIQASIISYCQETKVGLLGVTNKNNESEGSISRPLTRLLKIPIVYFAQ